MIDRLRSETSYLKDQQRDKEREVSVDPQGSFTMKEDLKIDTSVLKLTA